MKLASIRAGAMALVAILSTGSAIAGPTIVNGSFEDQKFAQDSLNEITKTGTTGWVTSTLSGVHEYVINGLIQDTYDRDIGVTPFGDQYIGLNAVYRRSFHSIVGQGVSGFTIGQEYALTFYFANLDGASDAKMDVSATPGIDGFGLPIAEEIFTAPVEGPYYDGTIDFLPYTLTFTATSTDMFFAFNNMSFTGIEGLDNVSIAAIGGAVPEPAAWAMMIGGFGLAGAATRRRRARPALA